MYFTIDESTRLSALAKMAERAAEKATEMNVPVVFAAVDATGSLKLLHRMENAFVGSVDIAANKAYTAFAFKMPTDVLGEAAKPGGPLYGIEVSNGCKVVVFGGGYPLLANGAVVGAIGVSGGSVEEDMAIARYALGE